MKRRLNQPQGHMGRPSGWVLTADEAIHLDKPWVRVGEPVPRIELTDDEKKALRRFRSQRSKAIVAFTAATDQIFAATKLVGSS